MNRQLLTGVIIGGLAATAVAAVAGIVITKSDQYADVVNVKPVTNTVSVPREQCHTELVSAQKPVVDKHQITGTVAGAVIGGLLGNQVGGGSGKDLATAGGAIAGGYAGNKVHENIQEGAKEQRLEPVCTTVYEEIEEPAGFEVTYVYRGEERRVLMDEDPGQRIRIEDGVPVRDN